MQLYSNHKPEFSQQLYYAICKLYYEGDFMTDLTEAIRSSAGDLLLKMWTVEVPPGPRASRRHSHMQFEICLVNRGEGSYSIRGKTLPMKEGDVFVFSSNEIHCITHVGGAGLSITNIHFEPRYLWGSAADSLSDRHINLCFSHRDSFQNRIPAVDANPLARIVEEIKGEFALRKAEYRLMIKTLLNRFLILLIRDYGYADNSRPVNQDQIRGIRRAVIYIDTHLEEPFTLHQLAKLAGISPNYFSSLFRQISNITLWDYISSKRIERAIRLLMEDRHSTIMEIALQCGFNNTANFNKVFKKQTGMTPTQYRKSSDIPL